MAALDLPGHTLGPLERHYPRYLSRERIRSTPSLLQEHSVEGGNFMVSEHGGDRMDSGEPLAGKAHSGSRPRLLTASPAGLLARQMLSELALPL